MKHFQSLLAVGLVLFFAVSAQAKAAFKGKVEMITTAQVIAIVEITEVQKVSVKGAHWTYRQMASAKVEKVLKGELPDSAFFYGDENFICARCHFEAGRYMVFLDRDGELLTGNNWQLSTRKISGDSGEKVEWFGDKYLEPKAALLSEVLNEITTVLAKSK